MTDAPITPAASSTQTDPFLAALQGSLLSQSSMISSDNSQIQNKISEAIGGVNQSNTSSNAATTLAYDRQEQQVKESGQATLTGALESQRGFATNTALIQHIQDTTDKNVKDLEMRKQELILQGNAAAAGKISDLQLQALQFQQKAQQDAFGNLLSLGGFMLQSAASNRAEAAQTFTEKNAISDIALRYGLTVQPGDTIDSITTRAQPFASEAQKLELDKTRAAITASNAQTQASIASANANRDLSTTEIDSMAQAAIKNPAVLSLIKNPNAASQVINKMSDYQYSGYKDAATVNKQNGVSKVAAQASVQNDNTISATDKLTQLKAIDEVYGTSTKESGSGYGPTTGPLADFLKSRQLKPGQLPSGI